MKKGIYANYVDTKVKCSSCGTEFTVRSLKDTLTIETCSACHPAYTGKSKTGKAAGRVEKFNKKYGL